MKMLSSSLPHEATRRRGLASGFQSSVATLEGALLQREDLEHAGILRHLRVHAAEERRVVVSCKAAEARRYGNVLLALGHVADDAAVMALAVVVAPQFLAGTRVV